MMVDERIPLHVVLVGPEIHWNTGNAGRTALAAGARLHIVRPIGFSLSDRELRRAGLDYWRYVEPTVWESWDEFEGALPQLGTPWMFSTAGARTVWEVAFRPPSVLVFGSETKGLPPEILERFADRSVRLPMHSPHIRSLNVSTAVGIAVYEVLRQWSR